MILLDTTVLALLFYPKAKPPNHQTTGEPVERASERIEHLVSRLEKARQRIVIPTPALSELLVPLGDNGPDCLAELNATSHFEIAAFDQRAAVEAAALTIAAIGKGDKRGGSDSPWGKVKIDRQIVAIAKIWQVDEILSDDEDIHREAKRVGIAARRTADLPLPPAKQVSLNFPAESDGDEDKPEESHESGGQ